MKGNATSLTRRSDYTDELVYSRDPEANTSLFATGEFLNGKTVKPFTSTCDGQLLACAAVLQSMPVSCHFRDCKALLSRIVSGAISSELLIPLPLPLHIPRESKKVGHLTLAQVKIFCQKKSV